MLRPGNERWLHHAGQVEVVSSLHRDGSDVANDLRWGVYVVFEAPNDYTARCFKEYGVVTDASGRVSALYRPFHLIGLELNVSILSAALRREATGAPDGLPWRRRRDGEARSEGGRDAGWRRRRLRLGQAAAGRDSLEIGGLPIGLANHVPLTRDVPAGQCVTWNDVRIDPTDAHTAIAARWRRPSLDGRPTSRMASASLQLPACLPRRLTMYCACSISLSRIACFT